VVYEAPMFALFEARIRSDIAQVGVGRGGRAKIIETAGEAPGGFGLTLACDAGHAAR